MTDAPKMWINLGHLEPNAAGISCARENASLAKILLAFYYLHPSIGLMNSKDTGPTTVWAKNLQQKPRIAFRSRAMQQDTTSLEFSAGLAMPGKAAFQHFVISGRHLRNREVKGQGTRISAMAIARKMNVLPVVPRATGEFTRWVP